MLNHRLINPPKDITGFVNASDEFLHRFVQNKKVFCALSGGVDSSATYLLLKHAKVNVIPVFIDHGLMRIIRGMEERETIKKLFPEIMIIDIRDKFLPQIYGEEDAENKRKLFKKAYSETISKVVAEQKCDLLADGTILPDIEESFGVKINDIKETMSTDEELTLHEKNKKGFVKSQHNLEITYKVEATVQPVASLTKPEVRAVLEYFKMPSELVYRKAFPGPALSTRIIGPVTAENLKFEKQVHDLVETAVDEFYIKTQKKAMIINDKGEQEPFQAFAAVSENVFEKKVTGLLKGKRIYDLPLCVKGTWDFEKLIHIASNLEGYARLLYELGTKEGKYDVIFRSINSKDARTASVTNLPISLLKEMCQKIMVIKETRNVYVDLTPKPPGTIEYV